MSASEEADLRWGVGPRQQMGEDGEAGRRGRSPRSAEVDR